VIGHFGSLNGLQFIFPRFDSFQGKGETKVGNFLVPEDAFVQVYFQVILPESIKNLFQDLQMCLVCVGVHQEAIEHFLSWKYPFHKSLERGWATEKSHGQSDPVKLTFAQNCKWGEWLRLFI
jgi:hypothetical protein